MSEVRTPYAPPTDREMLFIILSELQALRLAVEAIRTDLAALLTTQEREAEPTEPRPLRAGGGVMYWPTTGTMRSGEPR